MNALIIANRNYHTEDESSLIQAIKSAALVCTCNLGFITLHHLLQHKFFLTPLINVSSDAEVIRCLEAFKESPIKFYHSENDLDGHTPTYSASCPVSSWWDSGTHAIITIAMYYRCIRTITCFGFSDGIAPHFYFRKARADAFARLRAEIEEKNIRIVGIK